MASDETQQTAEERIAALEAALAESQTALVDSQAALADGQAALAESQARSFRFFVPGGSGWVRGGPWCRAWLGHHGGTAAGG